MGETTTRRRLAAIVAMDVIGYSRMMGADEEGTLSRLQRCRSEVIDPLIAEYGGRVVKTMGDGLLLEYPSVVAGVKSAAEIQRRLVAKNNSPEDSAPIRFRIGVHIGDVVVKGGDIFGDGVNVAARIEPLGRPDGVSVSDQAYRMVRNHLKLKWKDGGAHQLKNIEEEVRIWHWVPEGIEDRPEQHGPAERADKPSIAVMPFENISGDPDQDWFAAGLTEDLITDLSKIAGLSVVARSSSLEVSEQGLSIRQIAERLGVRNLLRGNVQKAGTRVRINAQLIDAGGGNLWAERFDGALENVFELQDEVGAKVVAALSVRLTRVENERLQQVHTRNLDAYELYVRAKATPYPPVPPRIEAARALFERVIELDPTFAGGYAGVSWMLTFGSMLGHGEVGDKLAQGRELAAKAVEVDATFGWSHVAMALSQLAAGHHADAKNSIDRALELLPGDADAHSFKGFIVAASGRPEEGIEHMGRAIQLNPQFIMGPYLNLLCLFNVLAKKYDEAIAAYEKNFARQGPLGPPVLCWAAVAYHKTGNAAAAKNKVDILSEQFPQFRLHDWNFFKILRPESAQMELYGLMLEAGVPE